MNIVEGNTAFGIKIKRYQSTGMFRLTNPLHSDRCQRNIISKYQMKSTLTDPNADHYIVKKIHQREV